MSLIKSYPSIPSDLTTGEYIVYYNYTTDSYRLVTFDNCYTFYKPSFGYTLYLNHASVYSPVDNSWVSSGSWSGGDNFFRYNSVVYSSCNVYDLNDNSHYFISSGYDSNTALCATVSSTSIVSDLFRIFLPVVSVVIAACVCFIGFRKAWSFFTNSLRGV